MSRYVRQEMLPEVGKLGQQKLEEARILVVGAGGLAAPVLQYLVGAGVGAITIMDADTVTLSNLHRQTLFRQDHVGLPKALVAQKELQSRNRACKVSYQIEAVTAANAAAHVSQADIVMDCADSFAISYILSDVCMAQTKPLISASVLGFQGYVGGFCRTAPSLRAVFPDLPAQLATCATAGVMGPVVGALGAIQAQMALSVILSLEPSPLGQLMTLDLRSLRQSGFRFDSAPEPKDPLTFIVPDEIANDDFVVDLRGEDEAVQMVTPFAQRLNVADFSNTQPLPETGQRAVLTCRSGLRAWQAARVLQTYWAGDIKLIAMGDPAPSTKGT